MYKKLLILVFIVLFFALSKGLQAQVVEGETYSLAKLSQEGVTVTRSPISTGFKEVGDTTFTTYSDVSLEFSTYFVNGEQYDNIFNPNPTGIYLNGQHFMYFCNPEKSLRQNFNNILENYEFTFLGKNYLLLINFYENCLGESCRYRCYNLFDITNPERIRQICFTSIFQGTDTFGEFNNDGILDFVRIAPKPPEDVEAGEIVDHYLVTAYSVRGSRSKQLTNAKQEAYYLYVQGDEEAREFQVLQADWFFEVKDTSGNYAEPTPYFAEYISFDPYYKYLYSPDGVRIEKNRWAVHITNLGDLEAAQEYCRRMQNKNVEEVYIMIDQYGGDITFQVFVGNFLSKQLAEKYKTQLQDIGIEGKLRDLRQDY